MTAVIGSTSSTDLATLNPFQAMNGGGLTDAFLAKVTPGVSALLFLTYLGGMGRDLPPVETPHVHLVFSRSFRGRPKAGAVFRRAPIRL